MGKLLQWRTLPCNISILGLLLQCWGPNLEFCACYEALSELPPTVQNLDWMSWREEGAHTFLYLPRMLSHHRDCSFLAKASPTPAPRSNVSCLDCRHPDYSPAYPEEILKAVGILQTCVFTVQSFTGHH